MASTWRARPRFCWDTRVISLADGPKARVTADCYAVATLEAQPRRYRYDEEQRAMEVVPYRIEIKGEPPEVGQFECTNHNGVRSPVVQRTARIVYVVSNAYMGRPAFLHEQMHKLATAGDVTALRAALEQRDWYAANLLIAGADGTLLYTRPGSVLAEPSGRSACLCSKAPCKGVRTCA
jgi:acyl-homoserine lactone acylase PvdQ